MPIIISLKEPAINLVFKGSIKDNQETVAEYDAMFPNLMLEGEDGLNTVIPLSVDCNIAFIKEVTQAEVDKRKKEMEERRNKARDQSGVITKPDMIFPRGGGRRTQ